MSKGPETPAAIRRQQVAQAAVGVFLRYGFARTTMGDIANAAGLTRPTLYLSFADKDAVFAAVLELMGKEMFTKLRTGLPHHAGLEARLRFACNVWGVGGFEIVLANPDAEDIFDLRFEPVRKVYAEFEIILTDILREPVKQSKLAVRPEELAHIISFSIKGFKATARDGSEMRRLIHAHIAVIVAAIVPSSNDANSRTAKPVRTKRTAKR